MTGDCHVRFREGLGVRSPRATRLIILVKSQNAGERVMAGITRYLQKLKVKVNADKSKVVRVQESSFLSFTFKGKRLVVTAKAVMSFKHRLKRLTGRSWGISMQARYGHIHVYVTGWMNYFGIGMRYTDIMELDHWLRRRIRMCYLKQWGRARKRIGKLIRRGSPRHQAILTGLSRKGYWHLAKTYATNCGLSKEYLQDQGLVSLRTLWIGIHYPATAR